MAAQSHADWFAQWSRDMAGDRDGAKVPALSEAATPHGTPKAGYRAFPRSGSGGRVPAISEAFTRKKGGTR